MSAVLVCEKETGLVYFGKLKYAPTKITDYLRIVDSMIFYPMSEIEFFELAKDLKNGNDVKAKKLLFVESNSSIIASRFLII